MVRSWRRITTYSASFARPFLLAVALSLSGALLALIAHSRGLPAVTAVAAPLPDRILFTSLELPARERPPTTWDVWVMNPDGSGRRPLARDPLLEVDPVWEPGGARIAFAAVADPHHRRSDIWWMTPDGSARRQLTRHPEGTLAISPVWSPDGRYLAYARMPWDGSEDDLQVWILGADGRGARALCKGVPVYWSPAGEILVTGPRGALSTVLPHGEFGGLWAVPPTRAGRRLLMAVAKEGVLSPDGKRLAWLSHGDGVAREGWTATVLWIAEGQRPRPRVVTRFDRGQVFAPRWSSDGRRLLYTQMGEQFWGYALDAGIHTLDLDTRQPRRLSPPRALEWTAGSGAYLLHQFAPLLRRRGPYEDEFFSALQHNELPRAKRLFARGMNPNARRPFLDMPALVESASGGDAELVRALLERGADVYARPPLYGSSHHSALYVAARKGSQRLARMLLDAGARPDAGIWEGAGESGSLPMIALLRARAGPVDPTAIVGAAERGHLTLLRALLGQGLDPNRRGVHGAPPLVAAANSPGGQLPVLQALLDHGAEVDGRSDDGRTALMHASYWGALPAVQLLIRRGADVNAADSYGVTSLMHAAAQNELEVVRLLLAHGAQLQARDALGDTLLTKAAWEDDAAHRDSLPLIRFLLDAGLDANHRSHDGLTPLMAAAQGGKVEIAKLLLQRGADPHARDVEGKTAVDWAPEDQRATFRRLIQATP